MENDEVVREHRADAPLYLRLMLVVLATGLVYVATIHVPRMTARIGTALVTVAVSFALLPVTPKRWRTYVEKNVVGYDRVWSRTDVGKSDYRLELRNRRNARLNHSEFALYEKLGGWGGPRLRIGKRNGDEPWPTWVTWCRLSVVPALHEFCDNSYISVRDLSGDRVQLSMYAILKWMEDNGWQYHTTLIHGLMRRLHEKEGAEERASELLADMRQRSERLAARNIHITSELWQLVDRINSTSRFRTQIEAMAIRDRIAELATENAKVV